MTKIMTKTMTLTCNNKDLPWFTSRIKSLLQDKHKLYKEFRRSNFNAQLLHKLNHLQEQLNVLIDPNKAHGHDISVHVLKVCTPSIYKPLEIFFNQCLETGVFLSEWKKGNIVPIHKKETNRH